MKKRSSGKPTPLNDGRRIKIVLVVAMLLVGSAIAVYNADSLYLAGERSLTSQLPATISPNSTNTLMLLTTNGNGEPAANQDFTITLVQGNDTLAEVSGRTDSDGFAAPSVMVPEFEGQAELRVETGDQVLQRTVQAQATSHLFLTTDKPIYQPGQTVHSRVLAIRGDQVVEGSKATFEVKTPDGDIVLRKDSRLNGFGVASLDYVLSDQLPLGEYEMKVIVDGQEAVRVVKVDEYVLPRFQIDVGDMKAWYTSQEVIDGYILAKYFFGQRVVGTAGLDINLYTGEEWVTLVSRDPTPLDDGVYEFTADSYVLARGIEDHFGHGDSPDSVLLEFNFTVTDTGDHVEHESYIVTYAKEAIVVTALADANVEGQTSIYYVVARFPDGSMAGGAEVRYWTDDDVGSTKKVTTDERGIAQVRFRYSGEKDYLHLRVKKGDHTGATDLALEGSSGLKVVPDRTTYQVGDVARLSIFYGGQGATDLVYYDVVADGFTIITGHVSMKGDRTTLEVPVTSDFGQVTSVRVYKVERNFNIARDVAVIGVAKEGDLDIDITPGKDTYLPQEDVTIQVRVTRDGDGVASVLGVSIVDNAVFELGSRFTGFEEVLAGLLPQYSDPIYQFMGYIFVGNTPMPSETLSEWRKVEAAPVETTAKEQGEDAAALQDRAVVAYWTVLAALGIVALVAMAALGPKTKKARVAAVATMLMVVAFGAAIVTLVEDPQDDDFGDFANEAGFFGGRGMDDEGAEMAGGGIDLPNVWKGDGEAPPPAPGGGGYTVPAKPSIVRQFFPETWAWIPVLPTDDDGRATLELVAPDSITSWDVSVIASTKDALVGVAHEDVTVFQEFFIEPDLPAKAFLGDTFPLKVQVYNYGDPTDVEVTLEGADWFAIVGEGSAVTTLTTGEVGHVEFTIELTKVGVGEITVTGESVSFIDTVIKPLRVKPVGDKVTLLEQGRLSPGDDLTYDLEMLPQLIENSENAWVKLQGGVEAAVIEGAENYIHYVSGCGEQSLSTLSIDVLAYRTVREGDLDEAKLLEYEMITNQGIIHELQYLLDAKNGKGRGIVWFPGDQDVHPWLTSWGVITFQDARMAGFTIDDAIIEDMQSWLLSQQKDDGSWVFPEWGIYEFNNPKLQQKKLATTAYVAHSLVYSGIPATDGAIQDAVAYIEANIEEDDNWDDPYVLAVSLKVLASAGETRSSLVLQMADQLHELRQEENGTVFWGTTTNMISNEPFLDIEPWGRGMWDRNPGFVIEATGYAAQALHLVGRHTGDVDGAIKFLLDHRSSMGGYFSTQDTVVAFQTIYEVSTKQAPVDMDVEILVDGEVAWTQNMNDDNRDLTYLYDLRPLLAEDTTSVRLMGSGEGFVMFQVYLEQWVPHDETPVYRPLELVLDYRFVGYDIDDDDGIDVEALVGESIPVVARVTNNEDSPVKMALVELVAPVGMTFDYEDFEHMLDEGKVDNVEYVDDMVRLYINDVEKGEDIDFSYHLIAEDEAQVTIAGVRVFDMYNALHEMILAPFEVAIGSL